MNDIATNQIDVKEALWMILQDASNPSLNYAVNYARIGLGMEGHELSIQCLYVLNNITGWRAGKNSKFTKEEIKAAREALKAFSKKG